MLSGGMACIPQGLVVRLACVASAKGSQKRRLCWEGGGKEEGGAWRKQGGGRGIGVGLKLQKADKRNKKTTFLFGARKFPR